jgi:hypothetical protein
MPCRCITFNRAWLSVRVNVGGKLLGCGLLFASFLQIHRYCFVLESFGAQFNHTSIDYESAKIVSSVISPNLFKSFTFRQVFACSFLLNPDFAGLKQEMSLLNSPDFS